MNSISTRAIVGIFFVSSLLAGAPRASAHEKHKHRAPKPQNTAPAAAAPAAAQPARAATRSEWQLFRSHVARPDYLHVLINPIPALGMILGVLLVLAHKFRREPALMEAGLVMIAATAVITAASVWLGQRAYDRLFETLSLESRMWLDVHMERAENFQYVFYAAGALASATLWARTRKPGMVHPLLLATILSAGLSGVLAGVIAHAGGQVQHGEFREGQPQASALENSPTEAPPERQNLP